MISGSRPATGQKMLDRITDSPVTPLKDCNVDPLPARQQVGCDETMDGMHMQDNGGVSGINEAGPVSPNMSFRNSLNSGRDMVVLPVNSDSEDSSVHPHLPDPSNGVSFSNESSSPRVSSSELSVSSAAKSVRVESSSSSCMAHSVCDSSPRFTLDQLSAVKNREGSSDTSSFNPTSSEEQILESTNECESGVWDRRQDYAAKNEEIGEVSESSGDVTDDPGKPPHLQMNGAASVTEDVVDCGPLRSPVRARSQHVPGVMQHVLPDGDISVEQNASGAAFSGAGKGTTMEQLVSDVSTQSKQWARLGARPKDRPSDNASTILSKQEKTNSAWETNSRQTQAGNMVHADVHVGSSDLERATHLKCPFCQHEQEVNVFFVLYFNPTMTGKNEVY